MPIGQTLPFFGHQLWYIDVQQLWVQGNEKKLESLRCRHSPPGASSTLPTLSAPIADEAKNSETAMFQTSVSTLLRNCVRPGTLRLGGDTQMPGAIERSIRVWLNVVNALLLRDIRVRAGRFYIGYLAIFSMPFLHLAIILIAWLVIFKRPPPFGNQAVIFYGISVLPFVIFVYPARQIMMSLLINKPLLSFSRVKVVDLFISRGILEFANGMAVAALVCVVLFVAEGDFSPRDPLGFLSALILTLYLGFGWGAYNAIFAALFPGWAIGFNLCFPVLWLGSGILFNFHGFPLQYAYMLSFNPLLHCVEWLRYAYYDGYPTDLLDPSYTFWFATSLIAGAFFWERMFRRKILGG
jgi:capsular polysaccharide transport system permease protein